MGLFDRFKAAWKAFRTNRGDRQREIAAILTQGTGIGVLTGAWTDSRIEMVRQYRHWVYIAVRAIAEKVASEAPNVGSILRAGTSLTPSSRSGQWPGSQKALTPLRWHESLEPVDDDHPLLRLLRDPNEPDTGYDLWYETVLFLQLTGNAYWWIPPNGAGLPAAAWVLPSHWVWPIVGKERLIEGYELRPVEGNYIRRFFPAEEIIHFRKKNPISKLDGFSGLTAGSQWVDTQRMIDRSRWYTFKNDAFPNVALEFAPDYMDPAEEDLERIEAKFLARYQGETRSGRPLLLPPGVKFHKLNLTPREMDWDQSAEQIRDNILALFGVPASVAMITKDQTYGSVLATEAAFCTRTINPLLRFMGQIVTEKLAWRYDEKLRVWWDDTTPQDPEIREKQIQKDLQFGVLTLNEVRAIRGYSPYQYGGDDPLLPYIGAVLPYGTGEEAQPGYQIAPPLDSPDKEQDTPEGPGKNPAPKDTSDD